MIAFIPARGGSKGLPGKNIRILNGKPLINYTIEAALNADGVDRVVVTTDSKEIADIAIKAGAEAPFLRPDYLASDTASAVDVYIHAAEYMRDMYDDDISSFLVLLPTAPLRNEKHIMKALDLFRKSGSTTVISVVEAETPPSWYMTVDLSNHLQNAGFGNLNNVVANRQIYSTYFIPNGAIYILNYELLKNKRTYYCDNTSPYVMSRNDSVDIDTIEDFEYAEFLLLKK